MEAAKQGKVVCFEAEQSTSYALPGVVSGFPVAAGTGLYLETTLGAARNRRIE